MVKIHPIPAAEPKSDDYRVDIDGQTAELYACRVSAIPFNRVWPGYQRSIEQTEMASFLSFDMEGNTPARMRVQTPRPFERAVVRPLSKMRDAVTWTGNVIEFDIPGPGQYTLEVDDHHHALHIFVNPVEDYGVNPDDPDVLYFGPGIHRPGKLTLEDDQVVFIDAGAVVHTAIEAEDKRNIRILGHGILDNSEFQRQDPRYKRTPTCVRLFRSTNVEIRGVIFRDACEWTVTTYHCENVVIDNAKTIGMWRYNSDGFDLVNSRNVIISNSFLRCFDDCVVLKGFPDYSDWNVENVLVVGCVLWCDWGRALEIGAETVAKEIRNVLFSDCDIIRSTHMAMDIQNSGTAHIHGVRFDDIRVEYARISDEPIYQNTDDMPYNPTAEPHISYLLYAELTTFYHNRLVPGQPHGSNYDIQFSNIHVFAEDGLPIPPSLFKGLAQGNKTTDVRIRDLYFNGKRLDTLEEARVTVGPFAEQIELIKVGPGAD